MELLLSADVNRYVNFAAIKHITAQQYFRSVKCYSGFLGHEALRADLVEDSVNQWLTWCANQMAPATVRGRKRGLTPVWNWLAEHGKVAWYNTRALRKTKVTPKPVQAWSIAQVRSLLAGADDLTGRLQCGLPGRVFMRVYVMLEYETGFRPGDMRELLWDDLIGNRLTIVQAKTQQPHCVTLSDSTMRALELLKSSGDNRIFPLKKSGITRWEKLLFKASAAHGFVRKKGQACGTLRKTHGTEVCRDSNLATAAQSLGHVGGVRIARLHYVEADAILPSEPNKALIDALANPRQRNSEKRKRTG